MGNLNDVLGLPYPRVQYPTNPYGVLYASVRSKFDEFRPVFESLPLDERFSFLYNYALTNDLFRELPLESTKSTTQALEFKNLGNQAFQQNKIMEALKHYTRCVAHAPPNTKELAVAFANRSAALFRLKRYEACLVDINRALNENHAERTEAWEQKLLSRKQKCVINLKEYCAAEMNQLVFLSSSTIDDDTLEEWIQRRKNECEFDENAMEMNYKERFYLPSGNLKNPLIPNASEKFTVRYSPERGRHMVATEDIKAGELLHIEKPFAAILRFDLYYKNCAYCFVRCEALIPCPTCSQVMYCSVRCRDDAYDRYHRIECAILPVAMKFGEEEPAWLALRFLFMVTKQGKELETILKHPAYQKPLENIDSSVLENFDSDFMHIYHLMLNFHRPEGQWHPTCINAVTYLYMLKHSGFFSASTGQNVQINHKTLTDVEAQVGNILFRLMLIVQSNAKLIWESYEKEKLSPDDLIYQMQNIAYGVYPFVSFYNHSCDQNVVFAFHKNTAVCHAAQPISSGEELCIDYGMFHHESSFLERVECLKKEYFFICECEACRNMWPTIHELNALSQHYRLMGDIDSTILEEYYKKKFAFQDWQRKRLDKNAHSAKLLALVLEFTSIFGKIIEKPCYDYFKCQQEIREIFYDRANFYPLSRDKVLINLLG